MSMMGEPAAGSEGTPPAEGTAPAAGATTQQTPEAIQAAAAQAGDPSGQEETFSREYVEQLRKEAAGYRTKAKEFEEAFSGYDPDSRAALLDITRQLADPATQPAAAKRLQKIAEKIMDGAEKGTATRPDGEEDPDQRPMTRKEWREEQARLQEEQEQAQAIRSIEEAAEGLGIKPGSLEYAELLYIAQDPEVAGDLTKAKELLDEHYAKKARERAEAIAAKGERWPGVPSTTGTPAGDAEASEPKTWAEARKSAMAKIKARAGAAS